MYTFLKLLHGYNHFLIMAAAAYVLYRSYSGWLGKKSFDAGDNRVSLVLMILTDLQLLMGLLLYAFFSPRTASAFMNMGAAMKDADLRYYAVEHITAMALAILFIHLGRIFAKKANANVDKHRKLAIYTTIAVLLILGSLIPKGLLLVLPTN